MIRVGHCFWYNGTGPASNGSAAHICVVLKIDSENGDVYLVPLSTSTVEWDRTCEIDVGEGCSLVNKKSFVAYHHAKKASLNGLQEQIRCRRIVLHDPVSPALLNRIISGIDASDEVENGFKQAFKATQSVRRILPSI